MFLLYVTLRLKMLIRILIGLGIFRSLMLFLILVLAITFLFKVKGEWIVPALCLFLLGYYHNHRKDKCFLERHVANMNMFFYKEYYLLSAPLILLELSKGYWLGGACMLFIALFIPLQKYLGWHIYPVKLKFLYVGNMEYIRMYRCYWLVYLFLFICSFLGGLHDNMRIVKVCMILWGIIQANAYYTIPDFNIIIKFKNGRTLQELMLKSNFLNVLVTYIPFIALTVTFSHQMADTLFLTFTIISCFLYLHSVCLLHYLCTTTFSLLLINCGFLLPIFFFSCFFMPLSIVLGVLVCVCSYMLSKKLKTIWN